MILSAINDEIESNFEKQVETLIELNIKYIELRKINGKYIHELTHKQIDEVADYLISKNLKVSVIDSPIGKKRDIKLDNYIYFAKKVNCKYIRIFYNNNLGEYNVIAKNNNLVFVVENEIGIKPESPIEINKKINKYSNIKLLVDIENMCSCGYNCIDTLRIVINSTKCIHVRNKSIDKYVGLNDGKINYNLLMDFLKSVQYRKVISAEFHFPLNNDEKDNRKMFKESIIELINMI